MLIAIVLINNIIFIIMNSKDDIIKHIYYDKSGFWSIKTTFDDVKKIDKTIKMDDIKQWFKENVEAKKQIKGMNSFIAPYPYYEYQFDLFFINDLGNQKYKITTKSWTLEIRYIRGQGLQDSKRAWNGNATFKKRMKLKLKYNFKYSTKKVKL